MSQSEQKEAGIKTQGNKSWFSVLAVVMVGLIMVSLDSSIVNVAVTPIMNAFQTNPSRIQWVVTIYTLTLGVVTPISSWLSNYLGFRKLYVYSLVLFTASSVLCAVAWDENFLIVARLIQGIGGGIIMPISLAMAFQIVPEDKLGSAMGIFGLSVFVAPALGPVLGGCLVEHATWRWIFLINLPIGIIGTLSAITMLPELPRHPYGKFDLLGAITSSAGLFCLLLAVSQGEEWGWTSLVTVMLFYSSAALLGLFVFHQLTTPEPLLNLRVFKYSSFTVANIMQSIIMLSLYGGLFYIPVFLQHMMGIGALKTGILLLPPAVAQGVAMGAAGTLYDKFGPKIPVSVGILVICYASFLLSRMDISTPLATITFWNILRSLGIGLVMMPLQTSMMVKLLPEEMADGSAINNIIKMAAASLGLAALTSTVTNRTAMYGSYLSWTASESNLNSMVAGGVIDQQSAFVLLQGGITRMAYVRAIDDIFLIMTFIGLLALLPTFFLRKGTSAQKAVGMTAD